MRQRRETVEHPFGTIKARMGATHFLTKTLPKVAAEMALSVLAYNLTRVMNIVGINARGSCLITQKTVVTRLHEAFLPAPHTGLRLAGPAHNLIGADTVCAQQDDLGPPDMLMCIS
jgi:Transposase DDE domain